MRILRWYEKCNGDALIGESAMPEVSLAELQKLFARPPDDEMVDCFPVAPNHKDYLQQHVDAEISLSRYDYFVECDGDA